MERRRKTVASKLIAQALANPDFRNQLATEAANALGSLGLSPEDLDGIDLGELKSLGDTRLVAWDNSSYEIAALVTIICRGCAC